MENTKKSKPYTCMLYRAGGNKAYQSSNLTQVFVVYTADGYGARVEAVAKLCKLTPAVMTNGTVISHKYHLVIICPGFNSFLNLVNFTLGDGARAGIIEMNGPMIEHIRLELVQSGLIDGNEWAATEGVEDEIKKALKVANAALLTKMTPDEIRMEMEYIESTIADMRNRD